MAKREATFRFHLQAEGNTMSQFWIQDIYFETIVGLWKLYLAKKVKESTE